MGGKSPAGAPRFHKPQTSFEVLNDVNSNLTNLYRCVREQPEERRTAAGEMLPLHFVQAATNILKAYFMLFSGEKYADLCGEAALGGDCRHGLRAR